MMAGAILIQKAGTRKVGGVEIGQSGRVGFGGPIQRGAGKTNKLALPEIPMFRSKGGPPQPGKGGSSGPVPRGMPGIKAGALPGLGPRPMMMGGGPVPGGSGPVPGGFVVSVPGNLVTSGPVPGNKITGGPIPGGQNLE